MFSDKATIKITAGKGGNGVVSFLHEKYREYGGPDGGDGGRGGNVYLVADPSKHSLYDYKTKRHLAAENGEQGKKFKKKGASGKDLFVKVPVGTVVFNEENGKKIFDLVENNQEFLAARGGEGGFGNAHFVSSVRQAPQIAEVGEKGEELTIRLELKLIADVGLIGLPNAGKSTLLSVISEAKPKIADYPFTTLTPNLGAVSGERFGIKDFDFVAADIPGLIEGASKGKGLGDEFLRHIERTRVLVHLIDSASLDFSKDFEVINEELRSFDTDLTKKPQIVVLTKADQNVNFQKNLNEFKKFLKAQKKIKVASSDPLIISAATHQGVKELISEIVKTLKKHKPEKEIIKEETYKVWTAKDMVKDSFEIKKEDEKFVVSGEKIERFARKTDFGNSHSVGRLLDIMKKRGILKELEKKGASKGSTVEISGKSFKL